MADHKADYVGQQLGPYRLTRLLGAGGFGEVYEADHRLLQQKRAIKLLLERYFHDPKQRERFLREARTLAGLDHPNILPVLEMGEEGNVFYLVMPFYHQGTLNDLLKQRTTPLPLAEVERFLAQMCAAVGHAHVRNIVHLDLKPDNMLMHEDGRLVLSDFGLAHLIKQGRLEAGSSASWGTPYYMAPEHIRGEPEPRSDLYALGVILYQLLTNQRPFTGTTPEAVMMKHLLEAPPQLRAASLAAPAALEPVMRKALEKQPEDRYATAEALLADFRAALSSPSPRAAQLPASGVSPAAPTPRMNGPAPVLQTTIPVSPERVPLLQTTIPVPLERVPHAAEPATITQATAALCEVDNCGDTAIGQCTMCARTFCASHKGLTKLCVPCGVKIHGQVALAKAAKYEAEVNAAQEYLLSGAARAALLSSREQPVDIYQIERRPKKGLFSRGDRLVEVVTSVQHGWFLGTLGGTWWALLDSDSHPTPLVRVERYSGGYKLVGDEDSAHFGAWLQAETLVRFLTRSSS